MEIPKLTDKELIDLAEITPDDIQAAIDAWVREFGDSEFEMILESD